MEKLYKRNKKTGFTLVEILIAVLLFSILSVVVFTFLKSSTESTLKQKTQQTVNDNVKNVLNTVSADLKSSAIFQAAMPLGIGNAFTYPSSVIFPASAQGSSVSAGANLNSTIVEVDNNSPQILAPSISRLTAGNDAALFTGNNNRLIFYARTDDDSFRIIEYRVILSDNLCRLDRLTYEWSNAVWSGLQDIGGTAVSIDGKNLAFNPATMPTNPINRQTILSLPNTGDAILLYTARSWDDRVQNAKRLAANQYLLKVICFQTAKPVKPDIADGYFTDNNGVLAFTEGFTNLIGGNLTDNKKNYRFAELETSVLVPSNNL